MFLRRKQRLERRATIERLYGATVAQARLPIFYSEFAVPDTVEGRFDLIVLHVYLLFRRLAGEAEEIRANGQKLFDLFLEDMDVSLRALGVGDLSVPRKMRSLGEAFYGRARAYEAALAEPGDAALAAALCRNIYGIESGIEPSAQWLARYVRRTVETLAEQDTGVIVRGEIIFPRPEEV